MRSALENNYINPSADFSPYEHTEETQKVRKSQRTSILKLLDTGEYMNRARAYDLNIWEPSARIHELRHTTEIATVWVKGEYTARYYSRRGEKNIPADAVRVTWMGKKDRRNEKI